MKFRYREVRQLEADLGVGISRSMPAIAFDRDIAQYSAPLDGVSRTGA
jgi:hypothetical protein